MEIYETDHMKANACILDMKQQFRNKRYPYNIKSMLLSENESFLVYINDGDGEYNI